MYKIELYTKESEIVHIKRPEGVELIIINDEFLNASGHISEIIVSFIFESIASDFLNKVGEHIYDFLKKIISKNNESKNKSDLKFQIKSKDCTVNFSGNNLNSKNTKKALKEFGKILDKTTKYSTTDQTMVFNEISNKWEFNDSVKSNLIDELMNKVMKDFDD